MKALLVYASWSRHTRSIAKQIAAELARRGAIVDCAPVTKISVHDLTGYDLLALGTYTHTGRASHRMRALCETIPLRLFDRLAVAIFGTQIAQQQQPSGNGGVDDLERCLGGRGCELALAPLRIELPTDRAFFSFKGLGPADQRRIKEFAADLWEASVPAPLI